MIAVVKRLRRVSMAEVLMVVIVIRCDMQGVEE
jgi:hypothetical protein